MAREKASNESPEKAPPPMDSEYWNESIRDYDEEVLDSLDADRRGIILRRLETYADPGRLAADFGCGVGNYVSALASRFKYVYAIDFAARLLKTARQRCAEANVQWMQGDLATSSFRMRRAHFGLCQNVLISPEPSKRRAILENVRRHIVRGGHLMVLVPSTESAIYAGQMQVEWNRRKGLEGRALTRDLEAPRSELELMDGLFGRDGVRTKHYLKEEAVKMLEGTGFEPLSVDKVEYDWRYELPGAPGWLRDPYPWDWLLVASKTARRVSSLARARRRAHRKGRRLGAALK